MSVKFLHVISLLYKTEWSWELRTWSHKMNLIDTSTNSPHYFFWKRIGINELQTACVCSCLVKRRSPMVPILAVGSDVRGGYFCSLSCSNLEFKQRYKKELLLWASTNLWVSRGSLEALSLYRRYKLDFGVRIIFSGNGLRYRYNLIYSPNTHAPIASF